MRHATLGGLLALALIGTACGSDQPGDSQHPDGPVLIDTACVDCTIEDPNNNTWQPTPIVFAFPEKLMFYGDVSSQSSLAPQIVTVKNNTQSAVLITDVFVVDDDQSVSGDGASDYFTFEQPDMTEPLLRGDELQFIVTFDRSSEQKDALLVVETTHASHGSLLVELSGKYFLW